MTKLPTAVKQLINAAVLARNKMPDMGSARSAIDAIDKALTPTQRSILVSLNGPILESTKQITDKPHAGNSASLAQLWLSLAIAILQVMPSQSKVMHIDATGLFTPP